MDCSNQVITLKGGFVVTLGVVVAMIDLQFRGVEFHLEPAGRFRVIPPSLLTPDDIAFIKANRQMVRDAIEYCDRMAAMPL